MIQNKPQKDHINGKKKKKNSVIKKIKANNVIQTHIMLVDLNKCNKLK